MIPSLETERMWARPVRLEDAEQVQKIFPQREIVKHLGAVVPWPYRKPFYNTNPFKSCVVIGNLLKFRMDGKLVNHALGRQS